MPSSSSSTAAAAAASSSSAAPSPDAMGPRKPKKDGAFKQLSVEGNGKRMTAAEKQRLKRYDRGEGNSSKRAGSHKLKQRIRRGEAKIGAAAKRAAQAELLEPTEAGVLEAEGELEHTSRFTQRQLAQAVDAQTACKAYDMTLDRLGPYRISYTADGRRLLLGGRKGHVAIVDWDGSHAGVHGTPRVLHEVQMRETVRDVAWLRDQSMFAAAQHKNLYIYDGTGTELHCLRPNHGHGAPQTVQRLQFLRYHWLLASVGLGGHLRYLDVSTGVTVTDVATRLGDCSVMRANAWNGVMHLGHANGTVTLWSPNMHEPLVKMLCHKGAIAALCVDRGGRYMATSGVDGQLKVWDVRTYRPLHSYFTPRAATDLDFSDRGMLAAVHGGTVQVFKECTASRAAGPYVSHRLAGCVGEGLRFAPFEDVLGVGHSKGFCSMVVPGAGEPNFDSFEAGPFQTKKMRQESEVVALLEKLPPETIQLDPAKVNTVDVNPRERQKEIQAATAARLAEAQAGKRAKKKTRGRSKIGKREKKKELNIMDERRKKRQDQLEREREKKQAKASGGKPAKPAWDALDRFAPKAKKIKKS